MGEHVSVIDSAHAVAAETRSYLEARGLLRRSQTTGKVDLLVTDVPKAFAEVAGRFLGGDVPHVEQVDL